MRPSELGPCPACKRHVFVGDERCPFCGASWTRRGFMTAAAALIAAPVAACDAPVQETKYGAPRPPDPRSLETSWIWNRHYADWRATHGLTEGARSWASHKIGTTVTYKAVPTAGWSGPITVTYKLAKLTEKEVTLVSEVATAKPAERTLPRKPAEVKWEAIGNETIEIDGKKHDCEVKSAKIGGQELKVWFVKDGWVKAICGYDTTQLLKHATSVTAGGREHSCALWETVNGALTAREWRSADVPGLLVRREEMIKHGAETTLVIELTSVSEGK